MRVFLAFLVGLFTAAVLAALVIVTFQNTDYEHLYFLGAAGTGPLGGIVVAFFGLGVLVAIVLLVPPLIVYNMRIRALDQQVTSLSAQLKTLNERYVKLETEHKHLLTQLNELAQQSGGKRGEPPRPAAHEGH